MLLRLGFDTFEHAITQVVGIAKPEPWERPRHKGGLGNLTSQFRARMRAMARNEHRPIYRAAFALAVHVEKLVRNFSRARPCPGETFAYQKPYPADERPILRGR